ncbi:GIDE domain-containing protein [Oleiharenicola sp. Vm1]|uniref:GIDE domain-containing protein n=1 Tax=Oleiharenicola sp. Vm1 TaxID=3398393 RepID=UPI0039F4BFD7
MDRPLLPGLALALVSLGLLAWSLHLRRRHRLVRDLPTSKVRGVFIGLVELKGTAEAETPLRSHLAGAACVHYHYTVEERWSRTVTETYTDSNGKPQTRTRQESGWTTVAAGGEMIPFYLQDDTGAVLIRPGGAKLEPAELFGKPPRGATSSITGKARRGPCPTPTTCGASAKAASRSTPTCSWSAAPASAPTSWRPRSPATATPRSS